LNFGKKINKFLFLLAAFPARVVLITVDELHADHVENTQSTLFMFFTKSGPRRLNK